MTVTSSLGQLVPDAEGVRLEFTRTFGEAIEDVWSALTDPDRVARWIGSWTGDPATGTVQMRMSEEEAGPPATVAIVECESPTRLVVDLPNPGGVWHVSVTLKVWDGGTRMQFVHRLAEPYDAGDIGPGWQFYLDRLGAVVTGTPISETWDDYYPALRDSYALSG